MNSIRWEDMVFMNRNQSYGAYLLRKAYASRVTTSFVFAMTIVAIILSYPVINKLFGKKTSVSHEKETGKITILPPPPSIKVEVVIPPPVNVKPPKSVKFVAPRVTDKPVDEDIPAITELKKADVADYTNDGDNFVIDDPVPDVAIVEPIDNEIHPYVEQSPEFPGGVQEMMKFIAKNTKYPASAQRVGIEGTVFVSFVVNADGTIEAVEAVRTLSADCDKEAMRVVSKMPAWKPGKQNGKAVRVKFILPIRFRLN